MSMWDQISQWFNGMQSPGPMPYGVPNMDPGVPPGGPQVAPGMPVQGGPQHGHHNVPNPGSDVGNALGSAWDAITGFIPDDISWPGEATAPGPPGFKPSYPAGPGPHEPAPMFRPPVPRIPNPTNPSLTDGPPVPGHPDISMISQLDPNLEPLGPGQSPSGPELWEFGPGVPTGETIELGAAEREQRMREIEAASADNWGKDAPGYQDPMSILLSAYDQRTDDMISKSQEADKRNKWLEMAAGVLGSAPGDYTGAMANAFGVQADYNRRDAGYEGMRAERDSGKIDDLYKIMQTRKAAMGPQGAPMSEKDQWATAGMSPEEIQRWAQDYPGFKPRQFGDGIGNYLMDEQGNVTFDGDPTVYNLNTPEGQAKYAEADRVAQSRTAANKKQAGADIQADRKYRVWSNIVGDDPVILGILDIYPSANHEAVMRRAYENVVAELAAGEDVDISGMTTEDLGAKIEQWIKMNPGSRDQILESMRRGLPNR